MSFIWIKLNPTAPWEKKGTGAGKSKQPGQYKSTLRPYNEFTEITTGRLMDWASRNACVHDTMFCDNCHKM